MSPISGTASGTLPGTLPGVLRRAAREFGDRTALVEGDVTLTFSQLHALVQDTARGYLALGLQPGGRVAVWGPNKISWVIAALAATYAGGQLVPLNSRYTAHEASDLIERTAAQIVVVDDGFLGRTLSAELREVSALASVAAVLTFEQIASCAPAGAGAHADAHEMAEVEARADAVRPDDIADILFTSGTTGRSKGVETAHRQTIAAAEVWSAIGQVTAEDRYLVVSPFFHSYGYKVGLIVGLLRGCAIHPAATFEPGELLALIARERITVLPGAPAIFQGLLDHPDFTSTDTSSLRFANTGAASVPVALVERLQTDLSFEMVITAFGMTECCVATMCRPGDANELIATSCGRAVDGLEMRIVDHETGVVLVAGEEGEVQLRGPMVMRGYLDDPEATAEAIDPDGWLRTGDVGVVDADGYLRITDRLKDMYICGGFNVYPAEIEQILARHAGIADVAVIGVPDERLGEIGKAFVVRRPVADPDALLDQAAVIAYAREHLANFKAPRTVAFVDALPRNLAGKVLKNELRSSDD
ncbi:3-[(3aS,4S,7aS)-7a-methyl-1,5-dioxo-octahydro-1H- inden-4-yl]propanoyl:CoA ligase [Nocardioides baekrokdamisoli]|uniref:3-[(3aS,4S,7aS)-7a-methyl-1,5-dioxo-octahydro-1H-inden-4-yl]propanoyl:CoA ligase n=1 Tax=Nocardioides baekrokdamisoli TaxID=1804624 RepID=A0A3G9J1C1_9ACTN|nr:FadD3 family acyl-CoA ligase [Nocardioides baekrokdamisoli]BBH18443.1 3-[(3aS,4S,7aS)-7a-methyl-1,5-dioxo-octahydro-1H- inden-4-yl]propanoyl:CoA ligase [Nocardioides baekrokdamisoli]